MPVVESPSSPSASLVKALESHATALLEAENANYAASNISQSSSNKFYSTIMTSGTLEDRVSALTLVVQESPVHTMKAFENLVNLARKKSRDQAIMALGALKDLLGSGVVLPPDRKLRAFGKQPGLVSALSGRVASWKEGDQLPGGIQDIHLISWAYEDWLKHTYFDLLRILEGWSNDEVEYARNRAVTFIWELLKEKPEQEENLLRLLINKLGDTEKKVASQASYLLLQLQVTHPLMKSIIINAIESELLFRPGQSAHAKYYAIITLNQTVLSQKQQDVANKLLDIYFSLFVGLLKNDKTNKDPKQPKQAPNGQIQGGGGKPGKAAAKKAKLQEAAEESKEDLNKRMTAQILTGLNRAFNFAETNDAAFEKHLDALFRVARSSNFNNSIQALMLIQQISASKQYASDRFYRALYETLLDPRLLNSSKQILFLNLLYRSLKADINIKRVQAFVKRLLQIITLHEPPFACGVLYLVRELEPTFPAISTMLSNPEAAEEDEEESFKDVPEEGEEAAAKSVDEPPVRKLANHDQYDPRKRDPEHSRAERSCLWELIPTLAHFHPSVSLFASRLLFSQTMESKPDPTTFSLTHFLDRFIYRNARSKASGLRGSSIMQPLAGAPTSDLLIKDRLGGRNEEPLNTDAFWQKKREEVAPDEVFFHSYFEKATRKKSRAEKRAVKTKDGDGDDGVSGTDDDEEKEIWKALVGSRPEIEEPSDFDDDDVDIGDLMSDDEDIGEEEEGGGVAFHGFSGDEEVEEEGAEGETENLSDDGFDAAVLESGDEAAFIDSDEELPEAFVSAFPASDDDAEEEKNTKGRSKGKEKKRKLKHLPTFASAEDYAKLIDQDDNEEF
jgi:ribosome biogenesis protein MAK21